MSESTSGQEGPRSGARIHWGWAVPLVLVCACLVMFFVFVPK